MSQTTSFSDWVTRSLVYMGGTAHSIDLVYFGRNLPSDTLDIDSKIAEGHAQVAARRITSSLWGVLPSLVTVKARATRFAKVSVGHLTVSHGVAWPVASKLAEASYHVLRPISGVAAAGDMVLVTFNDGEHVRYHHTDTVWAAFDTNWEELRLSRPPVPWTVEWVSEYAVEPYSDRHPLRRDLHQLKEYCEPHDVYVCARCQQEQEWSPPPLSPPPIPLTA